jgi:hypothetical protein
VTNKLLIVTDLGVFKAYKVELTPRHTPRLVPVEDIVLEDARLRVIGAILEVWPWSLLTRARRARRPPRASTQLADLISTH